jgi:hypothetical protein
MAHIHNDDFEMAKSDPQALFAFRGTPRKALFNPGDRLFRFTSQPQGTFRGNEIFSSPWWHAQSTFNAIVRTANATGNSVSDAARSGLAVSPDWNPTMEWLVIIELTKPVYGWVGPARHQPVKDGDRSALFMGNADQAYVPGLATGGNGMSSPFANIYYYGSMMSV